MVIVTNQTKRRWQVNACGIAILVVLLLALLPTIEAQARSLDMYSQAQTIQIRSDGLQVDWKITSGPLLAESAWDQASKNQNGQITQPESQTWLKPFISHYLVSLDGQTVGDVRIRGIQWPASPDLLQSGEGPIDKQLEVNWPVRLTGQHQVTILNANQEAISLNSFALIAEAGIVISSPVQANGRLDVNVNFSGDDGGSLASLTSWESGRPNLSGVTATLAGMAGRLEQPGNTQPKAVSLSGATAA